MQSNTITLSTNGEGIELALIEAEKAAEAASLPREKMLELRLITEEMMAMLRSVTHELKAQFWLEWEGAHFVLHLSAKQKLSSGQRKTLVEASTSGKNEVAQTFLDKLRDAFVSALALDSDVSTYYTAFGYQSYTTAGGKDNAADSWDGFEKSLLLSLADEVKIGISGGVVDMTIEKKY